MYWEVPPLWQGETVAIIGGGPSLTQSQVDYCQGKCRVITINDQLRLAPWCDLHYFCDEKWWDWHHEKDWYKAFTGIRATLENAKICAKEKIHSLKNEGVSGLPENRNGLRTGQNSGHQCICLAVHLGVKRILLLGYDMKASPKGDTHWFGNHPVPTQASHFEFMLQHFGRLVEPLKQRGVEVINCTPDSKIECFKKGKIEDCLQLDKAAAVV